MISSYTPGSGGTHTHTHTITDWLTGKTDRHLVTCGWTGTCSAAMVQQVVVVVSFAAVGSLCEPS